jgi:Uma2 family endonuclease
MTLQKYLANPETTRPQELAYGILREPPAPSFDHQIIVGRMHSALDRHVRRFELGHVVSSPVDVVLDLERALVVQPDVAFISREREQICTDRIWGAPDLVVEVLSTATRRHDQTSKLDWYRRYRVRECWLVDPVSRTIHVIDLSAAVEGRAFGETRMLRSNVLPKLRIRVSTVFTRS